MDRWEYKKLYGIDEEKLNALGEQGWEVAGAASEVQGYSSGNVLSGISTKITVILKRRKP
ncbi:MAG TPA: hypothetical protein VF116_19930 [Ktedonobacterales bacterium]